MMRHVKTILIILMTYGIFYQQMVQDDMAGYNQQIWKAFKTCLSTNAEMSDASAER